MKKINRRLAVFIFPGILLFLGILFHSFILENILKPVAITVWFLIRVFILGIDQKIIWGILLFSAFIFFFYRFARKPDTEKEETNSVQNVYLTNLELWKCYFSAESYYSHEIKGLKWMLSQMLVSVYAATKRIPANYVIYDAFKERHIPLPENVHSFLFADVTKKEKRTLHELFLRITGHKNAGYDRNIEECLQYLENFLEINHDNKKNINR